MKLRRYWSTPWDWSAVPRPFVHADWSDRLSCFICIGFGSHMGDRVWAREWSLDLTEQVAAGPFGRVITWLGRRS